MGVYVLERDRQNEGEGAVRLAEPWYRSFNFKPDPKLIHNKNKSISGAIYQFESPSSHLPPEAPEYVIAFRGTVLKKESYKEDLKLDMDILHQRFHKRKHTKRATEAVESVVFPNDNNLVPKSNVWLVGHSLGSALALQAGKNVAKKNAILTTFLFNPPYPSLVTDIIRHEGSKQWIEKGKRKIKTKLANRLKGPRQVRDDKVAFAKLSRWSPHLFVNRSDWICSGYIGYFEQRKRLKETDSDEWMLDTMYSSWALLKGVVKDKVKTALKKGKVIKVIKKNTDYEPFYLLPSATLYINDGRDDGDKGKVKHGIRQWWSKDLQLEETLYPCDHCKLYEAFEGDPCKAAPYLGSPQHCLHSSMGGAPMRDTLTNLNARTPNLNVKAPPISHQFGDEEELEYQENGALEGEPQADIEWSVDDIVDV